MRRAALFYEKGARLRRRLCSKVMFADAQGAKMYCRMAYMHKKTLLQVEGEFFYFVDL